MKEIVPVFSGARYRDIKCIIELEMDSKRLEQGNSCSF